jgi:transcriptional regulator with XRE-family HTH domain
MSQLHETLTEAVETSGMSKTAFAEAVGLSRTSLFHILRGTSLPKRGTLEKFIRILGIQELQAGEWVHLLETARLNTIETTRKEIRSARQLFRSSVFTALQKEGECELDPSGLPDFWFSKNSRKVPVIAEGKIVDPYNLLGRVQMLRAEKGELKNSRWITWVCVSTMEPVYQKYIQDFKPFQIHVGTLDTLLALIPQIDVIADEPEAEQIHPPAPEPTPEVAEHHFDFSIECD